jgi:hypothetical protein
VHVAGIVKRYGGSAIDVSRVPLSQNSTASIGSLDGAVAFASKMRFAASTAFTFTVSGSSPLLTVSCHCTRLFAGEIATTAIWCCTAFWPKSTLTLYGERRPSASFWPSTVIDTLALSKPGSTVSSTRPWYCCSSTRSVPRASRRRVVEAGAAVAASAVARMKRRSG